MSTNRLIYSVLLCHFVAAMAALGMPLFLPYVLPQLEAEVSLEWAGILFVLPTLCTALAARFWGRFADRFGRRLSLLRAQLGLALGFWLCGSATSLETLMLGLIIQGTFGGAMAASNSYLASQIDSAPLLSKTLNKTQLSARLALVVAPISLSMILIYQSALEAYLYLALLPCLAFTLTLSLPKDQPSLSPKHAPKIKLTSQTPPKAKLFFIQFLFAFSMVLTFPYFAVFSQMRGLQDTFWISVLYALPHLMYLLLAGYAHRVIWSYQKTLLLGLSGLAITYFMHLIPSLSILVLARITFGISMVLCFHGLHIGLSHNLDRQHSGRIFATFDAMSKWGGVVAGSIAALFAHYELIPPLFLVAGCSVLLAGLSLFITAPHTVCTEQPARLNRLRCTIKGLK
ncbi:Multidrug resistance protein MdtG [Marinomonas aquimarina]|uniref:Multidrug resistance protein MdtG n=1 Tax=Marinomonas aquimarina TaxID=295068 RepID=A0A1A8TDA0_9GAMM|nr:MFS transporter [Marinomonas aquimarina]SBS30779.1 Multidrug resistance protein MdtG [Marinomonas aquimarina]